MTLPSTGPISLSMINVELGLPATTPISLNQASVRALAGVPTGPISLANLRGKSNIPPGSMTVVSGFDSGNGYGYSAGYYGSATPTSLGGVPIYDVVHYNYGAGIEQSFLWVSMPLGQNLTGTTLTIKNEALAVVASFSLASAQVFDTEAKHFIFWYTPIAVMGGTGSTRYVELT